MRVSCTRLFPIPNSHHLLQETLQLPQLALLQLPIAAALRKPEIIQEDRGLCTPHNHNIPCLNIPGEADYTHGLHQAPELPRWPPPQSLFLKTENNTLKSKRVPTLPGDRTAPEILFRHHISQQAALAKGGRQPHSPSADFRSLLLTRAEWTAINQLCCYENNLTSGCASISY